MIIATCGHSVDDIDDLVNCSLTDYTHEGDRAIAYVLYCKMCYTKAHKDGYVLYDEGEENKWLKGII
jgi:hypothetical protein